MTEDFPVLSAGPTPRTPLDKWTLQGGGSLAGKWSWEAFQPLPQTKVTVDIHCVTKWSKLGTVWQGVTIDDLLAAAGLAEPPAPYLMAHATAGKGGHFAAWEQPELFSAELRAAFRPLR